MPIYADTHAPWLLPMQDERRLTVLQVGIRPYPELVGGVDTVIKTLTDGLRARGHRVVVLSPAAWRSTDPRRFERNDVRNYRVYLPLPCVRGNPIRHALAWLYAQPGTLWKLRKILKDEDVDVVHLHTATSIYYYFLVLRAFGGPPYLLTFHRGDVLEYYEEGTPCDRWLARRLVKGARGLNAVSRWLSEAAVKRFRPQRPVPTVYNGVDDLATEAQCGYARSIPDRFMVVVGSFDPYKGHEVALRAWQRVLQEDGNLHLVIIGEGDLGGHYESVIRELRIQGHVQLLGQLSHAETLAVVSQSIAMVFPSLNEGLGYVLLEAGALGVPVICSDIAPLNEVVRDRVNGLLFPVGDERALASAVTDLAQDPAAARGMGAALRKTIDDGFTASTMTRGYEKLYADVLSG